MLKNDENHEREGGCKIICSNMIDVKTNFSFTLSQAKVRLY